MGMIMNPHEIEDTGDWLGCPTPLETCQHELRMYENEFKELTLQQRQQRERIQTWLDLPASGIEEVGYGRGKGTNGGSQEAAQEAREGRSEGRCIGG
jgi:hypothetical protein